VTPTVLLAAAADDLLRAWSFQPLVLLGSVLAIAFFLHGWHRLRARGRRDLAPWTRVPMFVGGVAIVVLSIVSPIDYIGERYLQWVHMLQHVLIADLGIALTLLAVRGPLTVFFLPRWLIAPLARTTSLRRGLAFALRPTVSFIAWVSVLVAWHLPALYEAALGNRLVHDLEHLSFVAVGLLVWTQLIDPARHGRLTVNERIGYAALVFWTGQVLAYAFVFGFEPYYPTYVEQPVRLLGLSPLTDQKVAGVVMLAEQMLTVGACFAVLLVVSRRDRQRRARGPSVGRVPA
jgi:cytochrome c oxidase assembly factor CtaG